MEFFDILKEASEDVGLVINEKKYEDFIKYKNLIKEWNEKINITAIKEDEEIVKKHFIDSFKVYKFESLKNCKKIIDVGTGGGFPGIPMKIINEDIKITLLDSLKKRINFLNNVVDELQLKDVETIHGRAEEFGSKEEYREQYDAVVSRAVANMSVLSEYCLPFLKVGGYFVALKGPSIEEEMEKGKKAISILGGKLEKIIPVDIEGSDLQHNLVVVKKVKKIEKKYPRNSKKISKNPLG